MRKIIFVVLVLIISLSGCEEENNFGATDEPEVEELTLSEVLDIVNGTSDIFNSHKSGYTVTRDVNITEKYSGYFKREEKASSKTILSVKPGFYEPIMKVNYRDYNRDFTEVAYYTNGYRYETNHNTKHQVTYDRFLRIYGFASEEETIIEESDIKDFSFNNYYYSLTFLDAYLDDNMEVDDEYEFTHEYILRIGISGGELKEYLSTYKAYADLSEKNKTLHYDYNVTESMVFSRLTSFELPDLSKFYDDADDIEEEILEE